MLRAIKYELNPTNTQKVMIKQTCGCCRLVFNIMLDRKISAYKESGATISAIELINRLHKVPKEIIDKTHIFEIKDGCVIDILTYSHH